MATTRTLTGKLVDAAQAPLEGIVVQLRPRIPASGLADPAGDAVVLPVVREDTTDAGGVFTFANLLVTDALPFDGGVYELRFTVANQGAACVLVVLPSGSGAAQLADVMLAETAEGVHVVESAAVAAAAAAAQEADAAAASASAAASSASASAASATAAQNTLNSVGRGFHRKGASSGLSATSGAPLTVTYASTVYNDGGRFTLNSDGTATCLVAGRYRLTAMVQFGNVVGTGVREFSIEINGAGAIGYTAAPVAWWRGVVTVTRDLAAGDVVRVRANQTSGSALPVADALFEALSDR